MTGKKSGLNWRINHARKNPDCVTGTVFLCWVLVYVFYELGGLMARARNIKPSLFKNELLGVADPLITLLFQSLWMLADREGRLEDRPLRIRAETFPYRENLDVNGYLTELERLGFIHRYTVKNQALIQVINFKKHQSPHKTEKQSEFPEPCLEDIENKQEKIRTVKTPLNNGEITEPLPPDLLIPDSLIPERGKKKSTKEKIAVDFILPDWINPDDWNLWIKTRKKKMQPEQMQAQVRKLEKWKDAGLDYASALHESAVNGWQGLFDPSRNIKTNMQQSSSKPYHEKITDTYNQIFGKVGNGTDNKIIDITPESTDRSSAEDFPKIRSGFR